MNIKKINSKPIDWLLIGGGYHGEIIQHIICDSIEAPNGLYNGLIYIRHNLTVKFGNSEYSYMLGICEHSEFTPIKIASFIDFFNLKPYSVNENKCIKDINAVK